MSCKIELSNCYGLHIAGGRIIGKVICEFENPVHVRAISVILKGKEKVHWYQNKTSYNGKNKFLEVVGLLTVTGRVGPGRVEYPFTFVLPQAIPSSYSGPYGTVIYSLKAVVNRPIYNNLKDKKVFLVIAPQDLNKMDKTLLKAGTYSDEKTVCCWCCTGGHISMDVSLEKRAFVPEEEIKVGVRILNNSNRRIKNVRVRLVTIVTSSIGPGQSMAHRKEVAKTQEDGVSACDEKVYHISLKLPDFVVHNFTHSQLLSFESKLEVVAVLPWGHLNLIVPVPTVLADFPVGGPEVYHRTLLKMGELNAQNLYLVYKQAGLMTDELGGNPDGDIPINI